MEELIIRIGKLVKQKRLEKGYTTQELAEKLDVSVGLVNNIENGKTDTFNIALMDKLYSTLDIELISLLANKTDDILKFLNVSHEVPKNLSKNINILIDEYLGAAIKLNFNNKKLETILNKIIYEIKFLSEVEK